MHFNHLKVKHAIPADSVRISDFLQQNIYLHRHLDWHDPLYWVDRQPFFLLQNDDRIEGLLSFAEDPPGIAWARTFALSTSIPVDVAWNFLYPPVLDFYQKKGEILLSAVCIFEWLAQLLKLSEFTFRQDIVTFFHSHQVIKKFNLPGMTIQRLAASDLSTVNSIDQAAFEPLWQTPLPGLTAAFHNSFYSTAIFSSNQMIGYLISTEKSGNAHLARIAVLPSFQGKGVATTLILDFLEFCNKNGVREVTLNTQSNNHKSIALYKKLGFVSEPLVYPVMVRQV